MTARFIVSAIGLLLVACAAPAGRAAVDPGSGDGFASAVAQLVPDSIMTNGDDRGILVAGDSTTARLFLEAGRSVPLREQGMQLLCPGSTLANGEPAPGPRGYFVGVSVHEITDPSAPGVRRVTVSHTCQFMHRGVLPRGGGAFMMGAIWELRLHDGRWRVARELGRMIT